jgi:hypothetical protein
MEKTMDETCSKNGGNDKDLHMHQKIHGTRTYGLLDTRITQRVTICALAGWI